MSGVPLGHGAGDRLLQVLIDWERDLVGEQVGLTMPELEWVWLARFGNPLTRNVKLRVYRRAECSKGRQRLCDVSGHYLNAYLPPAVCAGNVGACKCRDCFEWRGRWPVGRRVARPESLGLWGGLGAHAIV